MEHSTIIRDIFNDFLCLYKGKFPKEKTILGIHGLLQKYDRHPVLMGLLSNMDSAILVDVAAVMKEIYPLYKKYNNCVLDDTDWKNIVSEAEEIDQKWKENPWVRRIVLDIVNEMDKENQEIKGMAAVNSEMENAKAYEAA